MIFRTRTASKYGLRFNRDCLFHAPVKMPLG